MCHPASNDSYDIHCQLRESTMCSFIFFLDDRYTLRIPLDGYSRLRLSIALTLVSSQERLEEWGRAEPF